MRSEDNMIGPGGHEDAAHEDLSDQRVSDAQVRALPAIASAIDRVAGQLENLVATRL